MTTPPEIERKVRQLDNDVQPIYDLLTELDVGVTKVQAAYLRQGSRLDQVEDRLTGVAGKLDTVLDLIRRDPLQTADRVASRVSIRGPAAE